MHTTWDGLPIAPDEPTGATVVVRRLDGLVLLLHRAVNGTEYEGDWAWTAPAGARRPGEPILVGALRELAEEAGLSGVDIAPVDVGGGWALFTAEVPADTAVALIDPEHDRFEWVPPAEASARIRPEWVGAGLLRAASVVLYEVSFAPLTRDHLPALVAWQTAPHVARWWIDAMRTVAEAEAKYGPRIDGAAVTAVDVIRLDRRPVGFIQTTPLGSYADVDYLAVAASVTDGGLDAVAIDYAIGEVDLIGRGLGTRVLWTYARDVVFTRHPDTRFVVADPETDNVASVRACVKAGFRPLIEFTEDGRQHTLCVLDRARVFG